MRENRKLVLALVLLGLTLGSWWLMRSVRPPLIPTDASARHDPDYIVENFSATAMNQIGVRKYTLRARRLTHFPDDQTSHLIEPELTQYAQGRVLTVARADTGLIPRDGRTIDMNGNVRVKRGAGGGLPGVTSSANHMRFELE